MINRFYSALRAAALWMWLGALAAPQTQAQQRQHLWAAVNTPEHFVLLRHARAPGTGDPPQFTLNDCSTQRNLDDAGRTQARAIGTAWREAGIDAALVWSSQWCRCLDTARLLALGDVTPLPALNSFFAEPALAAGRLREVRELIANHVWRKPVVLVTHQVTITGLTKAYPSSGEMVVVKREASGELTVVGRLAPELE